MPGPADLLQRLQGIEAKVSVKERRLKELTNRIKTEPTKNTNDAFLEFAEVLREALTNPENAVKTIKQLIHRVDVSEEYIDITYIWNASGHIARGAYSAGGCEGLDLTI